MASIRKAKASDAKDCSQLFFIAGPGIFRYFFCSPKEKILEIVRMLFKKNDVLFTHKCTWVDEYKKKIRGAILVYKTTDKFQYEKNMEKYGKEFFKIAGFFNTIKMILHGMSKFKKYIDIINEDEVYIECLAVYSEFRGKKVSSGLLKQIFAYAKEQKMKKVSLLVELHNNHARHVYEKYGFEVTKTVELPKKYHKHNLYGFHKMIALV